MPESPKIIFIEDATNPKQSILKLKSALVKFPLSEEDKDVISAMKKMLFELGGTGLAAPQINVHKNITAIYIPEITASIRENAKEYPLRVLINAEYEPIEEDGKNSDFEACYSVKTVAGEVPRYNSIKVRYQTEEGEEISKIETGFYARVLQHEIDHLNGLLIIDRFTPDCLHGPFEEMMEARRQSLPVEKRVLLDKWLEEKRKKA